MPVPCVAGGVLLPNQAISAHLSGGDILRQLWQAVTTPVTFQVALSTDGA
jgi:hypothetical protein